MIDGFWHFCIFKTNSIVLNILHKLVIQIDIYTRKVNFLSL